MPYTNPWVGYTDRSFEQIKQGMLDKLLIKNPEMTDRSESNILVILISMFAGAMEMLGLYVDNMAMEAFTQTARRIVSMIRHAYLIDYRVKAKVAATADITLIALDGGGLPVATNIPYTIPALSVFTTANGLEFTNLNSLLIPPGNMGISISVKQITFVNNLNIGTILPVAGESFPLGLNYVFGTLSITINGESYTERASFGRALYTDKIFIVEVKEDGIAYVIFGDGISGVIPPAFDVIASYQESSGVSGNVGPNTIVNVSPAIVLPTATTSTTKIYNALDAVGGLNYQGIEEIRTSLPLSLRTLDRAVTDQDYEDIARLAPGVGRAKADYECGKIIPIYIAPQGGGIATIGLCTDTTNFFLDKKMVGTFPEARPAGETRIKMVINATAKFRADTTLCLADIQNTLVDYGVYENQNINRRIFISDIVAKIDNLPRVEYLSLINLGTIPYARPNNNHVTQLSWVRETLPGSIINSDWLLEYDAISHLFRVFKDQVFLGNAPLSLPFTDPDLAFTFIPQVGPYTNGMQWKFRTYPFLKDILLDDFTMPKVLVGDLTVTVAPQFNPPI